jgi:broad specificity phosphatase PhoE
VSMPALISKSMIAPRYTRRVPALLKRILSTQNPTECLSSSSLAVASSSVALGETLHQLGLEREGEWGVKYLKDYQPPQPEFKRLICIPHGRTMSNLNLLFQSHLEGPDGRLLPESYKEAERGADAFLDEYCQDRNEVMSNMVFIRSPMIRVRQTFEIYQKHILKYKGLKIDAVVDEQVIEINHSCWHGKRADELFGANKSKALEYRQGSFFAKPNDEKGESNIDLMVRCSKWLKFAGEKYRNKDVVVFGHGTYQNALETILCSLENKPNPNVVFTREKSKSHLKRGFPHLLYTRDYNKLVSKKKQEEEGLMAIPNVLVDAAGDMAVGGVIGGVLSVF